MDISELHTNDVAEENRGELSQRQWTNFILSVGWIRNDENMTNVKCMHANSKYQDSHYRILKERWNDKSVNEGDMTNHLSDELNICLKPEIVIQRAKDFKETIFLKIQRETHDQRKTWFFKNTKTQDTS